MNVYPHEIPCVPALQRDVAWRPQIVRTGAPERIYDAENADPHWRPRPVGFTAPLDSRGFCPRCERDVHRRLDGELRKHRNAEGEPCT